MPIKILVPAQSESYMDTTGYVVNRVWMDRD